MRHFWRHGLGGVCAALALCCPTLAPASPPSLDDWADSAFRRAEKAGPSRWIEVRRQDFATLRANASILGTPLKIAEMVFAHGLGTHANSELAVPLPAGARSFHAMVGVDNNAQTQGQKGTVVFSVEAGGTELFRSQVLHGGQPAVAVDVKLPAGSRALALKTDTTPDGPAFDHADWADARVELEDGSALSLDSLVKAPEPGEILAKDSVPFSFTYDGQPSAGFLKSWPSQCKRQENGEGKSWVSEWSDPKTGLAVTATAVSYRDFPAVDWVLRFENRGTSDTPILENVQALDARLYTGGGEPVVLDQIRGDDMSERSYEPEERELHPGEQAAFAPNGGRPSTGAFPFFNLQQGRGGLFVAIGWTGQWAASLERDGTGVTRVAAGMQQTHLRLHPGESIRTPRILLLQWAGERIDGHNQFRRLLLKHYVSKAATPPQALPRLVVAVNLYDFWAMGGSKQFPTEAGQIQIVRIEKELGCDAHWLDAGWFVGDFPNGVGNWICKPQGFPHGLAPVGEECGKLGLGFCLWYEPERVSAGSKIANEHPEFVMGGKGGGLFNLGDDRARQFMTDLLDRQITEFGVTTYRNDFNMEPLGFWRQSDGPDRQGISEIRYVEGLYRMWDELKGRHPALQIDDCASGGRRIDLETVLRSVVQTDSDTGSSPGHADSDQGQALGLNGYLPLHSTIGWDYDTYAVRSTASAGYVAEWDILNSQFPLDRGKADIAEVKENQKYCSGDYYPITAWSAAPDVWMGWQLNRPDLRSGIVLAFRRARCPYSALQAHLRGLEEARDYEVSFIDDDHKQVSRTMKGAELSNLELRLDKPHASLLVRYQAKQ